MEPQQNVNAPEDLANIAADIVRHEAEVDQLKQSAAAHEAEIERLKDKARSALGTYKKDVPAGDLKVSWTPPSRRFNPSKFALSYPPEQNPHMYKPVPAPALIPPELYAQFKEQSDGAGTVKVS